ncbi:hypothetical protein RKE30_16875 [Streptomyces sp. Li-HN-5-11]|uniref:hypothetical protein n=1 Tax=Streptomyces sp. Li-HN-5-11 TaxID=3075432 RepID=UPI0028A89B0D|nr:hypothetical protein [Streptomyces sp. Li-HN-5-11]WNM31964.1 hypothetical protein RKE30_16875 [Streptomyces sp. Li-HN-5-11]
MVRYRPLRGRRRTACPPQTVVRERTTTPSSTAAEQPAVRRFRLEDRYRREEGVVHLSGIQALVRILLDRSRQDRSNRLHTATFVSGYEGSPLAGYDFELARRAALFSRVLRELRESADPVSTAAG